jgi:hypothetical protein
MEEAGRGRYVKAVASPGVATRKIRNLDGSNTHFTAKEGQTMRANGHDLVQELPVQKKRGRPAKAKSEEEKQIKVPSLEKAILIIKVKGDSPLIMHKFSTKSKNQMAEKQQGVARMKKPPKDPKAEYEAAKHWFNEKKGIYGLPAIAFKKAAVEACRYVDGVSQSFAKGAFHVLGNILPIKCSPPYMVEDTVRVGTINKTCDLRYRPYFDEWSVELRISYTKNAISPEQLVNLFNVAGFHIGIGERRPGKCGDSFGMFSVE